MLCHFKYIILERYKSIHVIICVENILSINALQNLGLKNIYYFIQYLKDLRDIEIFK